MPGYDGLSDPIERIWRSTVMYAVVGAYPTTVIFGLPAFFLLRDRINATLLNCCATGAAVAALPWLIITTLFQPDSASVDGRNTVVDGSLTAYGWLTNLTFVGQIALFGAVGGGLFWLIAAAGSGKVEQQEQ